MFSVPGTMLDSRVNKNQFLPLGDSQLWERELGTAI